MADLNFFLNRQGVRGNKGEQGEQGYSPRITVKTETASEYVLNVQNEDGSFDTPNLRGNAIENLGGTYVRFDQDTEQMYAGYADTASTTAQGEVTLSTYEDLVSGGDESEVTTSKDVHDFVEAKISEASVNYVDIDDYTQKMGELDSAISDLDENKLDFTGLANTLAAGTNITITPNTSTGKITIAGEPVSRAQADWNQTDTDAPDYIKNKPTIPEAVTIDSELSSTSTNPVQNRLITNAINLISNEFENYATNKLDNLSNEGEARLHALKAYSDNGEVLTDAKGLSNITKYAHSTFDLSKFDVVGSPTITSDGILTLADNSNCIYIQINYFGDANNFDIIYPLYLTGNNTSDVWDYRDLLNLRKGASNVLRLYSQSKSSIGTSIVCSMAGNNGSIYNMQVTPVLDLSQQYLIKISKKENTYGVYYKTPQTDWTLFGSNRLITSSDTLLDFDSLRFTQCSSYERIDLKQFSTTVGGVEVFSGNKTGIDTYTINGNTITIPYTKSITGSKIAQASSRQDIATVATALGSANYYTLDEDNGNFTLPMGELYGMIEKAASTVPSGVVQSSTINNIVSLTQAEYDALVTKDANTFYVITPST